MTTSKNQTDEHVHKSDGSTANPSRLRCKICHQTYSYDTNLANSLVPTTQQTDDGISKKPENVNTSAEHINAVDTSQTGTTSNEAKEHNCGHNLVDWDGDGNCITCARDKIADPLGDMFEAMGVTVVDITPKDQSVTETPNTLPTGTQENDELRDNVILAIGRGNWERMHPTNRKKLMSLIQSHTEKAVREAYKKSDKFYEREMQHLKAFQEAVIKREELKIEPIRLCAVCSKSLNQEKEQSDE